MDPISKQYIIGSEYQLCSITQLGFDRNGYNFQKWRDNNGNEYSQSDLCIFIDSEVNITAIWSPIQYSINYVLDGGINNPLNPSSYNIESADIILQNASKDYYDFIKWIDHNGNQITSIPRGSIGDRSLSAIWKLSDNVLITDKHIEITTEQMDRCLIWFNVNSMLR